MSRITDYQLVNSPDPGDVLLIDGTNGTRIIPVEKVGVEVDSTLSNTGKAADAKKTGDELSSLKSDITYIEPNVMMPLLDGWVIGSIKPSTGANQTSGTRIRHTYYTEADKNTTFFSDSEDLEIYVFEYTEADSHTMYTSSGAWVSTYTLTDDCYYRMAVRYTDDRPLTNEDIPVMSEHIRYYLSEQNMLAYEMLKTRDDINDLREEIEDIDITPKIKDYYNNEMLDVLEKVRNSETEPALVFLWVTDMHRFSESVQNFDDTLANMRYLLQYIKADFVLNTGDNTDGQTAQSVTLARSYDILTAFKYLNVPYVFSCGNHDTNYQNVIESGRGTFNMEQIYKGYYTLSEYDSFNSSENGTDFYFDVKGLNIRVINLNSNNVNVSGSYAFGTTTANWLAEALNTEKAVILVTHESPLRDQVYHRQQVDNSGNIVTAIENFVNNGGTLIQLTGHSHVDLAFILPYLSIMQVCEKFETADITTENYQVISGYIDVMGNPLRTSGTYTEDAWSVCVYKPNSLEFDSIRFGAGIDRYFHVAPVTPQTLTTKLIGTITWSSSDTSIATVSNGVVTGISSGKCAILAKDESGNYECWIVEVA